MSYQGLAEAVKPEDQMRIQEVGAKLAKTAQLIQQGLAEARRMADSSLVQVGKTIEEDWKLAQMVALDWKDYVSALRILKNVEGSIVTWFGRMREKGSSIQFPGIYTPPVQAQTITATLRQTTGELARGMGTGFELPWWALPAGALLLFLLLRR